MEAFAANEIDVLVATTIIESRHRQPALQHARHRGLASASASRSSTSSRAASAAATSRRTRTSCSRATQSLTEQAVERLTAIGENTELGSGIKVAMRDLEIRGAGSLLGAEQSGQMSAVGFDLFAQMLNEAVSEARGEPVAAFPDIRVDLPVAAFLPEEYVDGRRRARALLPPPRRVALDRGDRRHRRRDGRDATARRPSPPAISSPSRASARWPPRPARPTSPSSGAA